MQFNFPESIKREKFINLALSWDLYAKWKAIADTCEIPVAIALRQVLKEALMEWEEKFGKVTPAVDTFDTVKKNI